MRVSSKISSAAFLILAMAFVSRLRADEGDGSETQFVGAIGALPSGGLVGDWTVGGKTVHVTAETHLEAGHGTFTVGENVEVEGTTGSDGSVAAREISLQDGDDGEDGGEGGGGQAEIRGAVSVLPAGGLVGDWTVGDQTVHVSATTRIEAEHGAAVIGAIVEVHGTRRADGSIDATNIEVVESPSPGEHGAPAFVELTGTVDALASSPGFVGDWTVAGTTVHVSDATRIDQEDAALDVGALVEVKGTKRPDGSIDARKIDVESQGAAPPTSVANTFFVPAVAHTAGRNGAVYTTDLTISNTGKDDASLELKFLGHDADGRNGPTAALTVKAGATNTIKDVLGSLFGIHDGFGAIRISSNVATLAIEATTSTPGAGGTFGQGHAGLSRNELGTSGRSQTLTGLRADSQFRTNLMVVNATAAPLDLAVSLVSETGSVVGTTTLHLDRKSVV